MSTERQKWTKPVIIIAIGLAAIWLLRKENIFPSFRDLFATKPVIIDETPILIKEIKSIGQVITATLYDEVVVDSAETTPASEIIRSINTLTPFPILPPSDKQLVLVARGKVLAGTDLNALTDSSVRIAKDTVWLSLPASKIIDVIMNPGDVETFEERGVWSTRAVTAVKAKAREKMIQHAHDRNILDKAGTKTKTVMEDFLHAAGFKVVVFVPTTDLSNLDSSNL